MQPATWQNHMHAPSPSVAREHTFLILTILTVSAFFLRVHELSSAGFAEDEAHKLMAVESYLQGDFTEDADHPMLMKALGAGMIVFARHWNQAAPDYDLPQISDEFAIRFPNVFFGALTTVPLYFLARDLFGWSTGILSALLWAIGINSIVYNRIAKEDTLLVFFLLQAFYFYYRAKNVAPRDARVETRWFCVAGAAFGMMLASKYFLHFLAFNFLYYYLAGRVGLDRHPMSHRQLLLFFGTFGFVFLVFNPAILQPEVWSYLLSYVQEGTMTHHGYLMMGKIYYNGISHFLEGLPPYFYVLYLLVKLPILLLLGLTVGLILAWKRRKTHPGCLFLLVNFGMWFVSFSFVPGKWSRYTLSLMPWVYMLSALGFLWILVGAARWVEQWKKYPIRRGWVLLSGASLIALILLIPIYRTAPHYGLFVNWLGGGSNGVGYYFPHDDFYDAGVREAIAFVARNSPPGSTIVSDTPNAVQYYTSRFGRPDLFQTSFCDKNPKLNDHNYVFYQEGRRYFENDRILQAIRRSFRPIEEILALSYTAVRIYEIDKTVGTLLVSNESFYSGAVKND